MNVLLLSFFKLLNFRI